MSDSRGPAGSGGTPFARDGSSDINHKNGISAQGGRIADSNTPIRFGRKWASIAALTYRISASQLTQNWNSILASRKAFLSAATNLPREHTAEHFDGRKKE